METQDLTAEELQEVEELQEDMAEDAEDDRKDQDEEWREGYGSPEPEEKQNQHSFLHKAAYGGGDTVRTTFLSQEELGRPLFNVRFLMDLEDISKWYLDSYAKKYGQDGLNRVSDYFLQKIHNITDSGMSNDGFSMKLNVTKKIDSVRQRVRGNIDNLQGGKSKR